MAAVSRLFLDASVWIAAAGSPNGGSALLVAYCKEREIPLLVTRLVLREAERNIQQKLEESALLRFYQLIGQLAVELVPAPTEQEINLAAEVVPAKDAHVLAGARTGKATHLISLDRKHFLREQQKDAMRPIIACTPGEFLAKL
jgi:predicted nucleic acid-binding protein